MSGKKVGVAALFKKSDPLILYTLCYRHALNFAVEDAICKVEILKEVFEITRKIVKLLNNSPQRKTKISMIREESNNLHKSIHAFCPKRWTLKGETLNSVLNPFDELL